MNKMKKLSLALIMLVALVPQANSALRHVGLTPPKITNSPHVRMVKFHNNMEEIIPLVVDDYIDDAYRAEFEDAVKNSLVYVNGLLIKHSEHRFIPISNNTYELQIIMPAVGFKSFFKDSSLLKLVAGFVEIKVKFVSTVDKDEKNVDILFPLIDKGEEWKENKNWRYNYGYNPFFKVQITISDAWKIKR